MKKLVAYFVDNSLFVNLIFVAVCFLGLVSLTLINKALVPPIDKLTIYIEAELPGATAVDVESAVTYRIEESMASLQDLEKLTSLTQNSFAKITVQLKPGSDINDNLTKVKNILDGIRHLLPQDLYQLRARADHNTRNDQPISYELVGFDATNPEHRKVFQQFKDAMLRIPGVLSVDHDLPTRDLYINISESALSDYRITASQVRNRIISFFQPYPVGQIKVKDKSISIAIEESFASMSNLENLPLSINNEGRGVRLKDVATIEYRLPETLIETRTNGRLSYDLTLISDLEADILELSKDSTLVFEKFKKESLPESLEINKTDDASELIEHELGTVASNGLWGVVLVIVVLTLFVGWRISAMVALGLPFCYLGLFLLMNVMGLSINAISLVAMILVVGILVDDAIIVAEEYNHHRLNGDGPRDAAINAVMSVGKPILGMAATTIVAFAPLLFLQGGGSWLIRPLPYVIIFALLLSIFESFFLLPNHLNHFVVASKNLKFPKWLQFLNNIYESFIKAALRWRYAALLFFACLAAAAVFILSTSMKFDGNLSISSTANVYVELKKPAESLDDLSQKIKPVEELIKTLPEDFVERYTTRLGVSLGGTSWKHAIIKVLPKGNIVEQDAKRAEIAKLMNEKLKTFADPNIENVFLQNKQFDKSRDVVSVYVSGGDRIAFTTIQNELYKLIKSIPGTKGIFWDETRFEKGFQFQIDANALSQYSLSKRDLQGQIRDYFANNPIYRFRHEGEEVRVFSSFDSKTKPMLDDLKKLNIVTSRGLSFPISYLGQWQEVDMLKKIEHEDLLRKFKIDILFDKDKTTAEGVAEELEPLLQPLRDAYSGYHISVKPSEHKVREKNFALKLALSCIGLIYVILVFTLGSLSRPLPVLIAIPFGFVGVVLAFYAHGMNLSLMAVIGILGLAGVCVNDSLVMATSITHKMKKGSKGLELIKQVAAGAKLRFNAVIMTSITTLAGVFPMAYGWAGETGWIRPMILAIGWGLLFATILTLILVPCIFMVINDIKRLGSWARGLFKRKIA